MLSTLYFYFCLLTVAWAACSVLNMNPASGQQQDGYSTPVQTHVLEEQQFPLRGLRLIFHPPRIKLICSINH
jgi:hypothetical protein